MSTRSRLNHPAVWIVLGAAALVLVVWVLPALLTREPDVSGAERHKAVADVRTGLIAMLGALGAAGGLAYTARTYRLGQVAQLTGRFQDASKQMGEQHPTVRLAGLHAMAQLADEWTAQRQSCVDVLCAYLRAPHESQPPEESAGRPSDQYVSVRRAAIAIIASRLQPDRATNWLGCDFDLTGATMDVGDFGGASFSTGRFVFDQARFAGEMSFDGAQFTGAEVSFREASFEAGSVTFDHAVFTAGSVTFDEATFSGGEVRFDGAELASPCRITFAGARLGAGGSVVFDGATFEGPEVGFADALFVRGAAEVSFEGADFVGAIPFTRATFHRTVRFDSANLSGAELSFEQAKLEAGGTLTFAGTECAGATFLLGGVKAMGGRFDLTGASGAPEVRGAEPGNLSWFDTGNDAGSARSAADP